MTMKHVSIPSSRVGTFTQLFTKLFTKVSIPSSRVGTRSGDDHALRGSRFHPLKSGRNTLCVQVGVPVLLVSIPSSRVGTPPAPHQPWRRNPFPSPQVGSEPQHALFCLNRSRCFHPLKSGRNPYCHSCRLGGSLVSIPSSRVGTFRLSGTQKSSRKFPSPQVGSER